jgi:hypothetical protein
LKAPADAQTELLDGRGHAGRHHAAHPAALDDQGDAPPVSARAGLGAVVAAAEDQLDHRMAALVLGHRDPGEMRIGGETLEDRQAHRCEGTVTGSGAARSDLA